MKWLEIIELRSAKTRRELLESQLHELMNEVDKESEKQTIKAYYNIMIDTDFTIFLFHDSTNSENSGSPLGLRLVSFLKEFGLVNHSVWVEMHNK